MFNFKNESLNVLFMFINLIYKIIGTLEFKLLLLRCKSKCNNSFIFFTSWCQMLNINIIFLLVCMRITGMWPDRNAARPECGQCGLYRGAKLCFCFYWRILDRNCSNVWTPYRGRILVKMAAFRSGRIHDEFMSIL